MMMETFYLHLEFTGKNGGWSVNLPFLCGKCGVCCTLEDFLTAGEILAKPNELPEVHARVRALFETLGTIWEADESEYNKYVQQNLCPFLEDKFCSIYRIRPEGCRLFPKTAFGMQTQDCEPLARFKKMRASFRKGRPSKETYYFSGANREPIKPTKLTEKQYRECVIKLIQVGMTSDELALFKQFNEQNKLCI